MNKIRIYHQPFEREDELLDVAVWVADEEMNFNLHDTFAGGYGPTEQGRFTDIPMDGVSTQAIRLYPRYQGWGHQWGKLSLGIR